MDGSGNNKKSLPTKGGKVNEMCREWLVREDGAFAYHLQAQEINQHYSGNKNRNQQVREDFPCALDEQLREQQLAEQAAAVYQRMLLEQEEVDEQIARELAERLEREEEQRRREDEQRRRAIEMRDESMARQLMHRDRDRDSRDVREARTGAGGSKSLANRVDRVVGDYVGNQPRRLAPQMPLPKSKMMEMAVQQRHASNGVDRNRDRDRDSSSCGQIMPKPLPKPAQPLVQHVQTLPGSVDDYHDLYTEPYQPPAPQAVSAASLSKQSQLINLSSTVSEQMGNMDISDAKDESSTSLSTTTTATSKLSSFDPMNQKQHSPISTPGGQQQGHQLAKSPPTTDNVAQQQLISSVDNQQQLLLMSPSSSSFDDEDELRRLQQEERDAEFARQLQEQETNSEENIMIRDRMLAMEAQDKELARLLQEREKAKARRAKERAKQRALQKKMALEQQSQQLMQGSDCILLPDDSYSNPVDLLPPKTTIPHTMPISTSQHMNDQQQQHDLLDDAASNYSLPVDTLLAQSQLQHQHHQTAASAVVAGRNVPSWEREPIGVDEGVIAAPLAPVRPSQLDLRSPGSHQQHQKISKPRYPDPPAAATATQAVTSPLDYQPASSQSQQHYQPHSHSHRAHPQAAQSYAPGYHQQQHTNIAMAIDPTYSRRHHQHHLPPQHQGGYHQQSHQAVVAGIQQQYNHNVHELMQGSHNSHHGNNSTPDNSNQSSSSQTTTPGTPCTPSTGCTSSSSSGHYPQHEHDVDEHEDGSGDGSPVPPYMPIQGQRRGTAGTVDTLYHQQGMDVVGGGGGASGGVSVAGKSRKKHGKEGGGGGCKQQ